jgi:hypothetical protein
MRLRLKVSRGRTVLGHLNIVSFVDVAARPFVAWAAGISNGRRHELIMVPFVVALCADGRVQVNNEGDGVEGKDERDDPFKNGGGVSLLNAAGNGKGDDEGHLDDDEGEFDPEGDAKDAMFTVVWAEWLVRGFTLVFTERNLLIPRRWYSQQIKTAEIR